MIQGSISACQAKGGIGNNAGANGSNVNNGNGLPGGHTNSGGFGAGINGHVGSSVAGGGARGAQAREARFMSRAAT